MFIIVFQFCCFSLFIIDKILCILESKFIYKFWHFISTNDFGWNDWYMKNINRRLDVITQMQTQKNVYKDFSHSTNKKYKSIFFIIKCEQNISDNYRHHRYFNCSKVLLFDISKVQYRNIYIRYNLVHFKIYFSDTTGWKLYKLHWPIINVQICHCIFCFVRCSPGK